MALLAALLALSVAPLARAHSKWVSFCAWSMRVSLSRMGLRIHYSFLAPPPQNGLSPPTSS